MSIKKNVAVSDSGFVFNPTTGDSFSVNPIGMEIIKLLKEGKSQEEIITSLLSKYATEKDTVEKDLQDFFDTLGHFSLKDKNE
jgi:hypothetical protein